MPRYPRSRFSAVREISRFHTARVKFGSPGAQLGSPLYPQEQTSPAGLSGPKSAQEATSTADRGSISCDRKLKESSPRPMRLTEPQYSKATPATLSGASEIDADRDVTARQFGKGSCVRV
jgi:hypothetical protein